MGILKDHTQRSPQIRLFYLIYVDAIVADLAVSDIIEPVYQVCNGSLAGACRSYKCNLLSRFCPEADIVQYDLIIRISEIHIIEYNAAFLSSCM